ncbi:MAG TPA: nucleotidyl transferase AbiEii/AbiGii toxin family protein [Spirochaetota bacterium]|nr:nucleotidyl transferase AbiEii/AbiGii toxin family protein [Spirochaetota bacterium]
MILEERLIAVITSLGDANLPCALAGGFAYGIHIIPRATTDIDLIVVSTAEVERIEGALHRAFEKLIPHRESVAAGSVSIRRFVGFDDGQETIVDFIIPSNHDFGVNILQRSVPLPFGGVDIPVVSLEDLYLLKKLSMRLQDLSDCEMMLRIKGSDMDWQYIDEWRKKLGIED